ncbi:MAG: CYTH domain-containing protein [Sphingobium sp.]
MKEIERKFLVGGPVPQGLPSQAIRQGYLTAPSDSTEVRVRQAGNAWFLTAKSGAGLVREEREIAIGEAQFETLWPATAGRRVEKRRYRGTLPGGLTFELDMFAGALAPLMLVEVEFTSEAEAEAFIPPAWFGEDVTADPRYRNKALALRVPD